MALVFEPIAPWHWAATLLVLLTTILMLLRGRIDSWRTLGRLRGTRATVIACSLLAGWLLVLAAWNPSFAEREPTGKAHLSVALDVSDSVLRVQGGWPVLVEQLSSRLEASLENLPPKLYEEGTADLFTFAEGVAVSKRKMPLDELIKAVDQLDQSQFASGAETDIAAALQRGSDLTDRAGGQGAMLLISDGNQTVGDGLVEAERLASKGIPVHVMPVESGSPELGFTAADLPRQVHSEVPTHVRGIMQNSGFETAAATLSVSRNPKLPYGGDHFGDALESQAELEIERWARLRQPLTFQGMGIQFADITLTPRGGVDAHKRRFFTHVARPPRILVVGGDFKWIRAISKDEIEIDQATPEEMERNIPIRDYDGLVISSVFADRFQTKTLTDIASAVGVDGLGLMMFNGDHRGLSEETESMLMSYKDTPLEPLLPVHPGPRPFTPDPPPRQVVIMVDTSGSMGGWRIDKAKAIARHIVSQLRPKDTLDLITFTTGVGHLVRKRPMDEFGKRFAMGKIEGMTAGGGTDPREALKLIAKRRMTDCGLMVISDGEFAEVSYRPDCRATAFAVGKSSVPANSPLHKLADPFPVPESFNPTSIEIPFFEPKPRDKFFEEGYFTPMRVERFVREEETIPVPSQDLKGSAVTHIKKDADLVAVRPKITDPILAYRQDGAGRVGVFASGVPDGWLYDSETRGALTRWLNEVISYTARDRYDFKISDRGETMRFNISLVARGGRLPRVDRLSMQLEINGLTTGVPLRADPVVPGLYKGQSRIPRLAEAQRATMVLRESGPESLPRPQRIPILIPAEGLVSHTQSGEAHSYGINEALLQDIAAIGGGHYDPERGLPLFKRRPPVTRGEPLMPFLLVIAVILYLVSFGVRRWDP